MAADANTDEFGLEEPAMAAGPLRPGASPSSLKHQNVKKGPTEVDPFFDHQKATWSAKLTCPGG